MDISKCTTAVESPPYSVILDALMILDIVTFLLLSTSLFHTLIFLLLNILTILFTVTILLLIKSTSLSRAAVVRSGHWKSGSAKRRQGRKSLLPNNNILGPWFSHKEGFMTREQANGMFQRMKHSNWSSTSKHGFFEGRIQCSKHPWLKL